MLLNNLCSPALLYLFFSMTQIIIDLFKNLYNTAFLKFIVMIIFTILLNILCKRGLGIISWFIVFVPFIFMTIITTFLLFALGLNPKTGTIQSYDVQQNNQYSKPPYAYNVDNTAYNLDELSEEHKKKKHTKHTKDTKDTKHTKHKKTLDKDKHSDIDSNYDSD